MNEGGRLVPGHGLVLAVLARAHDRNSLQRGSSDRRNKKPGLWLPPKDRDRLKIRLARPFSDLFNVAASRPAKSPRGRD
jgi:hypothetical protein